MKSDNIDKEFEMIEYGFDEHIIYRNRLLGIKLEKEIQSYLLDNGIWNIDMRYINDSSKWTINYRKYFRNFFKNDVQVSEILRDKGCPDFCIKLKNKLVFIECKYGDSSLSQEQKDMMYNLIELGYSYYVIREVNELLELINGSDINGNL